MPARRNESEGDSGVDHLAHRVVLLLMSRRQGRHPAAVCWRLWLLFSGAAAPSSWSGAFVISETRASQAAVKFRCSLATASRRFAIHSWQIEAASAGPLAARSRAPNSDSIRCISRSCSSHVRFKSRIRSNNRDLKPLAIYVSGQIAFLYSDIFFFRYVARTPSWTLLLSGEIHSGLPRCGE